MPDAIPFWMWGGLAALALGLLMTRKKSSSDATSRAAFEPVDRMMHEILRKGSGDRPGRHDRVAVHYTGWLPDGTVFDSSIPRRQPLRFAAGRGEVITGWDETVLDMQVGETRIVTIPPDKAYGDRRMGPIPAGSCLRFEMTLETIDRLS